VRRGDRLTVDLERAARREIARAGVPDASIVDAGDILPARACTSCNADLFFSHRRDRGRTGRAWAVAALVPAAGAQRGEAPV
jgi:copper oxidase (laccase) domain-containing protein